MAQAAFSVAPNRQVYFSSGNLQYQASTGTWRFAEQQYDIIGDNNKNISATYTGWIDLFGWGTSGWNNGTNTYQPYSTRPNNNTSGGLKNNLTGDYEKSDWGVYNAINNGGNVAGQWRTLTYNEWNYLLTTRPNAAQKYGVATVNGVNGCILLPDNFTLPTGLSFNSGVYNNNYGSNYYKQKNEYTKAQWEKMETAGAVFLPAAGSRVGTDYFNVGLGYYWSSTYYNNNATKTDDAGFMYISSGKVEMSYSTQYYGHSVRLVKNK